MAVKLYKTTGHVFIVGHYYTIEDKSITNSFFRFI